MKRLSSYIANLLRRGVQHNAKKLYLRSRRIPWSTGYSEYKYDFIGEFVSSSELDVFNSNTLPKGYGYRLDERAVEYPWFLSRLKDDQQILLDAGSVLNIHQILKCPKLANRKLYICTLNYEGIVSVNPPPSYIYEDLRSTCFKSDFFDAICCISTLEHIGMDNTLLYTNDLSKRENDKFSYLAALKELSRVLKRGGTLYLTIPYGRYNNFGWFQIFDSEMVKKALEVFKPSSAEVTYFKYEHDQWNFSDRESCKDANYFDINTNKDYEKDYLAASRCVICLELIK